MSTEELGMRMRLDGVVETANGIRLTGDETEKMARKLDTGSKALDGMGMSAKQTRQAMRELPMQFTDIATSLASGMPAWLVFIQQGGQIRDRFGGAVPALSAIGSLMSPLAVGAGGAAAAVGLLGLAYAKAQAEAFSFEKAAMLSGQASGYSAEQMQLLSRELANLYGTQQDNAAAMAALASSGRVMGGALEVATRAAVQLESVAGVAVKDTVRQFAELGKDPVKASAALNEQTNYLTKAVFDQIVKLKEQGKESEAAALAQSTYANTVIERTNALNDRLGTLQRGWKNVGEAAGKAWELMMNVGRPDTKADQMAGLKREADHIEAQLARNLQMGRGDHSFGSGIGSMNDGLRSRLAQLRQQLREVAGAMDKETSGAFQIAADAADIRKHVDGKLKGGKGKAVPSLGAIRDGRSQTKADFLRSEKDAYDDIDKALRKVAETEAKRAADQEASFAQWYANEQAKAALEEQKAAEKAAAQARDAWEKARRDEEEAIQKRSDRIAESIYSGIENGFREGMKPADIFIRELKAQFARTVLRVPVEFMSQAFNDASSSLAGSLLGLFTGGLTVDPDGMGIPADLPGNPQGRRASGGRVGRGSLWEVAEEGPELLRSGGRSYLMTGGKDGYVHSASATRSMGGGRSVVFSPVINIDSRTDSAQIRQLVVNAVRMGQSDLLQKMDRGEV